VWALIGQSALFRSSDRGATWERRFFPTGAVANAEIAFVNDREGWISSVSSPGTQCQSQAVSLWHTVDGAATWQQLTPTGIADAQCKSRPSFTDAQHGFLVASDPNNPPVIYRTTDGGRTWSASRPLANPPGVTTGPAGFELGVGLVRGFGPTLLVPVTGPNGNGQYAYRSTDGGATWTYAATAPEANGLPPAFATATRWLQLVVPGQARETTDGGTTWHNYTTDYQQAAPIAPEVIFADASVGYATIPTRGSIQRTVDGGAHWTTIKTPGTG
jgi:photosystem II stability/assembly factor-like uncharacterized protein